MMDLPTFAAGLYTMICPRAGLFWVSLLSLLQVFDAAGLHRSACGRPEPLRQYFPDGGCAQRKPGFMSGEVIL
jgi:hypothetical protein